MTRTPRLLAVLVGVLLTAACSSSTTPEAPTPPQVIKFGFSDPAGASVLPANLPAPAGELAEVGDMPKLAAFVGRLDEYTADEIDALANFDLFALRGSPTDVSEIHRLNPDARCFYRVMPQAVGATNWERSWSWMDTVRRYVNENDWTLRHDDGGEATMRTGGYWRWLDFTDHCPEGTSVDAFTPELDSRGLTVAEWLAERFIPWFVANRFDGYEGLWWEIIAERPSPSWFHFDVPDPETGGRLDWDRNGIADMDEGGWSRFDAFSASWMAVAESWVGEVRAAIGQEIPIIGAGDGFASHLSQLDGFKNEDFLNRNRFNGGSWTWWDEFYSQPGNTPRRGYVHQRNNARQGWDLSINQIFWYDNGNWSFSNPLERARYVRLALGTTLLGNGYFSFYDIENGSAAGEPLNPWLEELYEVKIGTWARPFQRHVEDGDTLYIRYFDSRVLIVNPNERRHLSVGAEDAKIFELPGDYEFPEVGDVR